MLRLVEELKKGAQTRGRPYLAAPWPARHERVPHHRRGRTATGGARRRQARSGAVPELCPPSGTTNGTGWRDVIDVVRTVVITLSVCVRRFICEWEDCDQRSFDERFEGIDRGGAATAVPLSTSLAPVVTVLRDMSAVRATAVVPPRPSRRAAAPATNRCWRSSSSGITTQKKPSRRSSVTSTVAS